MGPSRHCRARVAALFGAVIAVSVAGTSLGSTGSLESRLRTDQAREGELDSGIGRDERRIDEFSGTVAALRDRLAALETSLRIEREVLASLRSSLAAARSELARLRVALARDRQVLVAQVVAAYTSPPPDVVTVILSANGFADLLERVDEERVISRENASITTRTAATQKAVTVQAARLQALEESQARETSAVGVQRDEVAQLHLALLKREYEFVRARDRKSAELQSLQESKGAIESELSAIATRELAASGNALAYTGPVTGFSSSPEGAYGFFPAPGTNYSVGQEPTLAARLNTLGLALHLPLIGISGYRTPEHSVEVGGFANDPHTRGEASDTPGVEGVPEATLERFGLTRPFPGPAEADHIQLF
jgi:peptidoglycan hydrolase CwlO-like protein